MSRYHASHPKFLAGVSIMVSILTGCPESDDNSDDTSEAVTDTGPGVSPDSAAEAEVFALPPTHTGLVSFQDISIANLPAAGHGLTVTMILNAIRAPDYVQDLSSSTGCRAWSYDVANDPPPALEDHGTFTIRGIKSGTLACSFQPNFGYICPTAQGSGPIVVGERRGPLVSYALAGSSFSPDDVGRYLRIGGAHTAGNNGAFPIVAAISNSEVQVVNAQSSAEAFSGTHTVLAGAGPTPGDGYSPFDDATKLTVSLEPGGGMAFDLPATELTPGKAFALDADSATTIMNIPLTGAPVTLGCSTCGDADGTIVRISTTDADLSGASPVAMPPARRKQVEIQCLAFGTHQITVPAGAMELLRAAHAISPITRIRTAFMREGIALATSSPPRPPNQLALVAGRGILGFTQPPEPSCKH